jgi:glycosyltransferase involved in cell wall biosynthesis
MRIAMVGSRGIPALYGGSETAIEEIGERLVRQDYQVVAYCRRHNSKTRSRYHRGIERVVLPSINTKNLDTPTHTLLSTLHILLFRKADVVHFHGMGNALFLPLLKAFGIKSVVTIDGPDWQRPKWGRIAGSVLKLSAKMCVRYADALIIDNFSAQDYFEKHFGTRGVYIPYGAYPERAEATDALDRLGLEPQRYAIFVGRLIPDKGCHTLVEAWKRVRTDMKLVLVGDSPYFRDYIRDLKANADERVLFPGYIFGEPYRQLVSHAYLYAHPLFVDGTSPSLLQAMGFGNCIVLSDVREAMDVAGDVGYSFRVGDAADLARVLQMLIDRPELVAEARERSRRKVLKHYNWDRIADQHEALYLQVLGKKRGEGEADPGTVAETAEREAA